MIETTTKVMLRRPKLCARQTLHRSGSSGHVTSALGELKDIAVHEGLSEQIVDAQEAFAAGRLSGREEARIASVLKDAEAGWRPCRRAVRRSLPREMSRVRIS